MDSNRPPPPSPPSSSFLRHLINFDTTLSLHLHTLTHPILPYYLLKSLEISGDGRLFFPILLSILLSPFFSNFTPTIPAKSFLINLLLCGILDLLLIGLLKHLIRRPRPVYNKNMFLLSFAVDHWSFPSGHCSRVSFIASLFYFYSSSVKDLLIEMEFNHFLVDYFVLIVSIWALVTSISRVLLGRHFVFDVLAGICLGILEAFFVFRVAPATFFQQTIMSINQIKYLDTGPKK